MSIEITTKQGFKVVGILPYEFGTVVDLVKKNQTQSFNEMQKELKKEYSNKRVLFDRDINGSRILFFIC